MKKLTERQVEHLLREASGWEPDVPMEMSGLRAALADASRRRERRLYLAAPLLAVAGAAGFLALAPRAPEPEATPALASPSPVVAKAPLPVAPPAAVARLVAAPPVVRPAPRRSRPLIGRRRASSESGHLRLASAETPGDSPRRGHRRTRPYVRRKPRLREATGRARFIALDESPDIVPIVIAEAREGSPDVYLHPAALVTGEDNTISLE